MARAGKKRVAYRKRHQNRFSMLLVGLVVTLITVAVAVSSIELRQRLAHYEEQEAQLQEQIHAEELRAAQIEEFRKYTQTKSYKEEVAREKLGLMYEGEVLYKKED